ncbi:MAG: ABC transporter ATP-binding protein [Spirochaetaceae bacterium]|jgi:putative ABC transport system ATP-binding protein|nr:ABC transporter ATP-binding protein [Spirochaetaceae bacterium]HPX25224.1 ABC transporter ATP-binding protein [Treponemataceae bacterium]
MEIIIEAKNLNKTYNAKGEKVLNNVSLEIQKGSFTVIMGPSGSGKSTLLYTLSGMEMPDAGTVTMMGKKISSLPEKQSALIRRETMGFVFQQTALLKNLNLLDNVLLPVWDAKKNSLPEKKQRALDLFAKTGIQGLESRMINEVSGGQLQRAGICRALMGNPDVIFCDEPTGALNSASAQECMALFYSINQEGKTIILVTHDASVASWADRILFMRDGVIVGDEDLSRLRRDNLEIRAETAMNLSKQYKI